MHSKDLKLRLNKLMQSGREKRFFPFWVVVEEKTDEPLYDWCMYVVNFFISHKQRPEREEVADLVALLKSYSKHVEPKGDYPFDIHMQEFLKVSADLAPSHLIG
jgi:hypothetical protein